MPAYLLFKRYLGIAVISSSLALFSKSYSHASNNLFWDIRVSLMAIFQDFKTIHFNLIVNSSRWFLYPLNYIWFKWTFNGRLQKIYRLVRCNNSQYLVYELLWTLYLFIYFVLKPFLTKRTCRCAGGRMLEGSGSPVKLSKQVALWTRQENKTLTSRRFMSSDCKSLSAP